MPCLDMMSMAFRGPIGKGPPFRAVRALSPVHLSFLILLLILIGLSLLILFPLSSAYSLTSPSGVWLMRDGQWAQVQGSLDRSTAKSGGLSFRLCEAAGGCVSIYAPEQMEGFSELASLRNGQPMRVWGEVSSAQYGARFIRAHRFELLANSELNP